MTETDYMQLAIEEAKKAAEAGEVPVGAVVVYRDEIIGKGRNTRENDLDISGHAEIKALQMAAKALGRWSLEGCRLYVTLEPCLMCAGAILQSRVSSLCFGAKDAKEGAIVSKHHVYDGEKGAPLLSFGVAEEACAELLTAFFSKQRNL